MWAKTIVGIILSLVLSMSLFLNIAYLVPFPRDVYLFIGFVGGFLLWGGLFTVFYCYSSIKRPLLYCLITLAISATINGLFYTGVWA
ncbi:hypothetical protein [Planctobacterium marinum]|uniref:hypothetical protein n=1 Tax=Planctobacterium marinum TaxID=1631968 RepID=UPI001E3B9279|nr:hypothetical protein [Planctobacterium marinum]MCC2607447.1 hypothetical protein [Planctobacterium marinum]